MRAPVRRVVAILAAELPEDEMELLFDDVEVVFFLTSELSRPRKAPLTTLDNVCTAIAYITLTCVSVDRGLGLTVH